MAKPVISEIGEETPRAQPQQSPNDPVVAETEEVETSRAQAQQPPNDPLAVGTEVQTPRAQPQQRPNDPLAAENNRQRIDPELLRAIVNGDLMGFNKNLEIDGELTDIESLRGRNGGNNGLNGVSYGENTALHVVAGVTEKSSQIPIFTINVLSFLVLAALYGIGLVLIFLLFSNIIVNQVKKYVTLHFPWIPQKIYKKAKRTWWLKWVLFFNKRRMYLEIANIIYLQNEALLYARNRAEETPLHCAANAGNLHMVSLLIKFAREVSKEGHEDPEKIKRVLRARNKVGETALHEAARSGYSGIVKELLGTDENLAYMVDNNGISPVEESGAYENLASLVDDNGISPLYLAVFAGCRDVVQQLIAAKHPPSYAGPDRQNVLHAAVMGHKENITRVILESNTSLAAKTDKAGNTPLHYAALFGNTCAVRKLLLLQDTEPVYKGNLSDLFPVHLAAEAGNAKVIKELLRTCPDVGELLDKEEKNFLHVAVENKRIGVIMMACREGINAKMINAKDKDGNTPLHLAVISSESEIVALLCQNKSVNPNIRNEAGLTPLDLSSSLQNRQFTYSLNPQSIIHHALVTRGAFQNSCQPDLSKKVDDFLKARADNPNRREGKEMWNGVEVDIEKESTKYENMSKSLITGAVLIASATFVAIFTVSGVYKDNNSSHTWISRRNVFKAFVIVNVLAFLCAIVSTMGLLYSALPNFHLKYRKFYFQMCTPLLYRAINLFILTFGLGAYITIAPLSEWLAILILVVCVIAILQNAIWNPQLVPLIHLAPYITIEEL